MKKLIIIMLLTVLFINSAQAVSCPLPEPNTDSDINLNGFQWYCDYNDVLSYASNLGIGALSNDELETMLRDHFNEGSVLTPHWTLLEYSLESFAGSEKNCGGMVYLTFNLPQIAGYKIDNFTLYMMKNLEQLDGDYHETGVMQLYMGRYEIDVTDKKACYDDLVEKLKSIYGNNPLVCEFGLSSENEYTCWINNNGAMVGVSYSEYNVYLIYMAPNAEEKLVAIEEAVKAKEIEGTSNNLYGL